MILHMKNGEFHCHIVVSFLMFPLLFASIIVICPRRDKNLSPSWAPHRLWQLGSMGLQTPWAPALKGRQRNLAKSQCISQ